MVIDRRSLLIGGGGFAAQAALASSSLAGRSTDAPLYAAARRHLDGSYTAAIVDAVGGDVRTVMLPGRGHDICWCRRSRRCVAFARRPGNFAVCFTPDASAPPVAFSTPADRHFYGHGVFSPDGRLLYATENDFEHARGTIGVYDTTSDFRRIGELPTYGAGPHDIAHLTRQPVLVVANGGYVEHPDFGGGRRILNPGSVETSLCFIDSRTGELVDRQQVGPPGPLSLRHLDVAADDSVAIGAQVDGPADPDAILLWLGRMGEPLRAMLDGSGESARLCGYVSSVAFDSSGSVAAVTSSKGGVTLLVEVARRHVLCTRSLADVSGVAPASTPGTFIMTAGTGAFLSPTSDAPMHQHTDPVAWDNHLARLS